MKIGDILVLCENHYVSQVNVKNWQWKELNFYKGDRFEVIGKSERKDWMFKKLNGEKVIFDEYAFNAHKYKDDISAMRNKKLKQLGII